MHHITRRAGLGAMLAMPALLVPRRGAAQWAPARSIRLIAPYTPGGGVDTTARLIAGPIGALLGQPVIVENRAGAGGSLGAAELARSAPDGQTVMVDALAHTVNPALIRNLPFDYATAFTPITQLAVLPQIMIVPNSLPVTDLAGFIAMARARPGLPYGSSGNATAAHLAAALLLSRAGLQMEHVPYRGGTAALPDVIAGNINFVFGTVSSSLQLVREGRVRALGVTTAQRIPTLPEVPTIAEQGFAGYELNEWNGFYAPAGLPAPVLARLHEAALHALGDATLRSRFDALGAIPVGSPQAEFAAFVATQRGVMATLVREARIEAG
jgi:tripartite-type tricarboxylate transporter receptor subunit TctC